MTKVRFALIKGESPVLGPVSRDCERAAYSLLIGQGGPTGRLDGERLDGNDLFGVVNVPRDLGPLALDSLRKLQADGEPVWRIHVGEDWDPFLGPLEVQGPVLEAIDLLAEEGLEIQIRTRAALSRTVADKLALRKNRIRVEMPFVSMRPEITAIWEPESYTPGERLRSIRRLTSRGLRVTARVDPLLPLINDTQADFEEFCVAFSATGIHRVAVSYLQLTPERAKAMSRTLSRMHRDILKGCFVGRPWQKAGSHTFKTLPRELRERGLTRFLEEAQRHGLAANACGCTDGSVMAGGCHNGFSGTPVRRRREGTEDARKDGQLDFFGAKALGHS